MRRFALFLALSTWCAGLALAQGPSPINSLGMTPSASNAVLPDARTNLGVRGLADVVKDGGAVCDGTTVDTTAIQNTINSFPGAFIQIPGACKSGPLTITTSNTVLGMPTGAQTGHDVGTNCTAGPRLIWDGTGGGGAILVQVASPSGGSNQAIVGSGLANLSLCGSPPIAAQFVSVRNLVLHDVFENESTTAGFDIVSYATSQLGEATDPNAGLVYNNFGRQITNAAPIWRLRGPATAVAGGNVSFNTYINNAGQYKNQAAIYSYNSDNNRWENSHFTRSAGGTAYGLIESNDLGGFSRNNQYLGGGFGAGGKLFRGGLALTVGGTITTNDVITLTFTSSLASFPITLTYTVLGGDTMATIATALKNAINANATLAADGFAAVVNANSNTVVQIQPNNTVYGEATVAASVSGGVTETVGLTPTDGVMVGTPTIQGLVLGTDITNAEPAPVITFPAQVAWLEGNGALHSFGNVTGLSAATDADLATAFSRRNANQKLAAINYCYDSSQSGCNWWDDGTGLWRLAQDSNHALTFFIGGGAASGVVAPIKSTILTKTGNYNPSTTNDISQCITNTGASAEIDSTLAAGTAALVGISYCWEVDAAQIIKIIAPASTTISIGTTTSAAAGNITSNVSGSQIRLRLITTTKWVAESSTGTWTVN